MSFIYLYFIFKSTCLFSVTILNISLVQAENVKILMYQVDEAQIHFCSFMKLTLIFIVLTSKFGLLATCSFFVTIEVTSESFYYHCFGYYSHFCCFSSLPVPVLNLCSSMLSFYSKIIFIFVDCFYQIIMFSLIFVSEYFENSIL